MEFGVSSIAATLLCRSETFFCRNVSHPGSWREISLSRNRTDFTPHRSISAFSRWATARLMWLSTTPEGDTAPPSSPPWPASMTSVASGGRFGRNVGTSLLCRQIKIDAAIKTGIITRKKVLEIRVPFKTVPPFLKTYEGKLKGIPTLPETFLCRNLSYHFENFFVNVKRSGFYPVA